MDDQLQTITIRVCKWGNGIMQDSTSTGGQDTKTRSMRVAVSKETQVRSAQSQPDSE